MKEQNHTTLLRPLIITTITLEIVAIILGLLLIAQTLFGTYLLRNLFHF